MGGGEEGQLLLTVGKSNGQLRPGQVMRKELVLGHLQIRKETRRRDNSY